MYDETTTTTAPAQAMREAFGEGTTALHPTSTAKSPPVWRRKQKVSAGPEGNSQESDEAQDVGPSSEVGTSDSDEEHVVSGSRAEAGGPATNHRDIVMDMDSGTGVRPRFFMADAPTSDGQGLYKDLVSNNVISLDKDDKYFNTHENWSLDLIRGASALLTVAACTVGALHSTTGDYDTFYPEFLALSNQRTFFKTNTIEDVQVVIWDFWSSELSWILSGAAVRIAAELQVHIQGHPGRLPALSIHAATAAGLRV
ncbi:uncharacterized protein E0L32_000683 [Thyridium curvatum]|uniref:Uncharacterized protein n=1 Tax=Thyridium curvatum TaxID=1093900 RepID=A0A507B0A5_9PEZI|nr:uncharacterized protein E0L32_000683 [Thyridium curvatum]TPX12506.1 hypothetical protein E0L32_000683 [Thyridium curvatum]